MCAARGRVKAATDVDHKTTLRRGGDPFDPDNLQSLCHECHSLKTAEDKGGKPRLGCDVNGNPLDPRHHWAR